jgi:GntR family transcriptional regulator
VKTNYDPDHLHLPPISAAAPGPLYDQIVEGMKQEISAGRIPPGAPVPSIRKLAQQLLVSVITVKRAYEELEREGVIYRKQGLGTFVAEDALALSQALHRREAEEALRDGLSRAQSAGMKQEEVMQLVKRLWREQ